MSQHQASTPPYELQRLELKAPLGLEAAISYQGEARWLGLYWEPELNHLCCTDGQSIGIGSEQGWQLFCNHPTVKPLLQPYGFGNDHQPAQHSLLLDRISRQTYVGKSQLVDSYLSEPQTLALLADLDSLDPTPTVGQQSWLHWLNDFPRPLIVAGALLALLGLPIIGFGAAVILDEADWLEAAAESIQKER